jgi:hypothetical protein
MTKDEALRMALEALETELSIDWTNNEEFNASAEKMQEAITAIKQALAAPVQEPVAIALNTGTKQGVKWLKNVEHGESLYTTPPAAPVQEPVVFFDWYDNAHWGNEDFKEGCHRSWNAAIKYTTPPAAQRQWVGLTRWEIDAKLKEKNT